MFRALRRHRQQAALFLSLAPGELRRRWFWLCKHLGLEGAPAAAYLASAPSLLLADPADAAAVVRWLRSAAGWRRIALRRNLQRSPAILLSSTEQLEDAAQLLQGRLDASLDELCLLLAVAPRLLALTPGQLAAAAAEHPSSWRLAAHWMDRPSMMMRDAAVRPVGLPRVLRVAAVPFCSRPMPLSMCRPCWRAPRPAAAQGNALPTGTPALQEALHLQISTLYLMHTHGWSRQQVADLARHAPTLLRGLHLPA